MEKQYQYHFDMVRINSRIDLKTLYDKLDLRALETESHKLTIKPPYPMAKRYGYSSCIEIVVPTIKALNLLDDNENIFGDYSISHIEIARDLPHKNKEKAIESFNKIKRRLSKKYTTDSKLYDAKALLMEGKNVNSKDDPLLFSDQTLYLGPKSFQYVVYPRLSKIDGKPVLHAEWRIGGAAKIKQKTGIKRIRDLISFDIPAFHEKQDIIQLLESDIDLIKLGKWQRNKTRKRNFTEKELSSMLFGVKVFLNAAGIKSFADLKKNLLDKKKEVKSKPGPKSKRGPKYRRDLKRLNIDPNIFRKSS